MGALRDDVNAEFHLIDMKISVVESNTFTIGPKGEKGYRGTFGQHGPMGVVGRKGEKGTKGNKGFTGRDKEAFEISP